MKLIQRLFIALFCLMLILPMVFFNVEKDVVSEIDNRKLTEFPFEKDVSNGPLPEKLAALGDYVSDRIGFRDEMIHGYTLLHGALFGLEHPSYMAGQDGYIFLKKTENVEFSEFHQDFAKMVIKLDQYCKERGVPFLFVFTPEKASILRDKLPAAMNYNNEWVGRFLRILDENGVSYVDNTVVLREKTEAGEAVFNQKYNAGHWNDLGAFYGVNAILEKMREHFPDLHVNSMDEFTVTKKLNTTLQNSRFPIHESELIFSPKTPVENVTDSYAGEVKVHPSYRHFYATVNPAAKSPRTLSFQGSYMINMGYKFMSNALHEYIGVHDYQNILELDYYFNLFEPEAVVFEAAEYTFLSNYFNYRELRQLDLAPPYEAYSRLKATIQELKAEQMSVKKGQALTTITVKDLPRTARYAYLQVNNKWIDMSRTAGEGADEFTLTLNNETVTDTEFAVSTIDRSGSIKTVYD